MGPRKKWIDSRDRQDLKIDHGQGRIKKNRAPTVDIVILVILLYNATVPQCHYNYHTSVSGYHVTGT